MVVANKTACFAVMSERKREIENDEKHSELSDLRGSVLVRLRHILFLNEPNER